jgi:hypothetical protein
MKQFKSPGQVQRFLSIHDQVANLFYFPRNRLSAVAHRIARTDVYDLGRDHWRFARCIMLTDSEHRFIAQSLQLT